MYLLHWMQQASVMGLLTLYLHILKSKIEQCTGTRHCTVIILWCKIKFNNAFLAMHMWMTLGLFQGHGYHQQCTHMEQFVSGIEPPQIKMIIIFSEHNDVQKVLTFPESQGHKRKVWLVVRIGATLFNTLFQCKYVFMNAVIHWILHRRGIFSQGWPSPKVKVSTLDLQPYL